MNKKKIMRIVIIVIACLLANTLADFCLHWSIMQLLTLDLLVCIVFDLAFYFFRNN